MESQNDQFETIACGSAKEFIEAISQELEEAAPPDFRSMWYYRGCACAGWDLRPAAWRDTGKKKLAPLRNLVDPWVDNAIKAQHELIQPDQTFRERRREYGCQTVAEVYAVSQFCEGADELGLLIPDADKMPYIRDIINLGVFGVKEWHRAAAPNPIAELFIHVPFALAQHHGIPTRYLDWSRDPLVAAFFAVRDEHTKDITSDSICVWATSARNDETHTWVLVPRGQHGFLHAQHGLFSFDPNAEGFYKENGKWPSFEDAGDSQIRRWTLPAVESEALRRELHRRRISRAHLMPILDNVAQTTISKWKWY